jgi:hypothetical protein
MNHTSKLLHRVLDAFRITPDPSSGIIDSYLIKSTRSACCVRCRRLAAYSGPVVCVRAAHDHKKVVIVCLENFTPFPKRNLILNPLIQEVGIIFEIKLERNVVDEIRENVLVIILLKLGETPSFEEAQTTPFWDTWKTHSSW